MGRQKFPVHVLRQPIFGRVEPETAEFLRQLGAPNDGRAIDLAVTMLRECLPKVEPIAPTQPETSGSL